MSAGTPEIPSDSWCTDCLLHRFAGSGRVHAARGAGQCFACPPGVVSPQPSVLAVLSARPATGWEDGWLQYSDPFCPRLCFLDLEELGVQMRTTSYCQDTPGVSSLLPHCEYHAHRPHVHTATPPSSGHVRPALPHVSPAPLPRVHLLSFPRVCNWPSALPPVCACSPALTFIFSCPCV